MSSAVLNPQWGLLLGILCGVFLPPGHAVRAWAKTRSRQILQLAVVFMGLSLPLGQVIRTGIEGFYLTAGSLVVTGILAFALARVFRIQAVLAQLIGVGTAICGGSAIAALIPILKPSSAQAALSLTLVFSLNAVALWVFPAVAGFFDLSPETFGTWAALAIHDTSSVVAAAQVYHSDSIGTATTLKLTRALWILPLAMGFAHWIKRNNSSETISTRPEFPRFIFGFLLLSAFGTTLLEIYPTAANWISLSQSATKVLFLLALFLTGIQVPLSEFKSLSWREWGFAVALWVTVSATTLVYLRSNF